jgi:hypothetical protein
MADYERAPQRFLPLSACVIAYLITQETVDGCNKEVLYSGLFSP